MAIDFSSLYFSCLVCVLSCLITIKWWWWWSGTCSLLLTLAICTMLYQVMLAELLHSMMWLVESLETCSVLLHQTQMPARYQILAANVVLFVLVSRKVIFWVSVTWLFIQGNKNIPICRHILYTKCWCSHCVEIYATFCSVVVFIDLFSFCMFPYICMCSFSIHCFWSKAEVMFQKSLCC